jgi:L-asparaginase II
VNAASIPEQGVGIALKTEDGTGRAAEVALVEVLSIIGMIPDDTAAWNELREPIVRNHRGFVTGKLRCVK